MRKGTIRRAGLAGMFLAGVGVTALGVSMTTAQAATRETFTDVVAQFTGGDATALAACINHARNGNGGGQRNRCSQLVTAGNALELDGVTIRIQDGSHGRGVKSYKKANIQISGGEVVAAAYCINDAADGTVDIQQNACDQTVFAGNIVNVTNVTVIVKSHS